MRSFVGALTLCFALAVVLAVAGCASGTEGGTISSISPMTNTGGTSATSVATVRPSTTRTSATSSIEVIGSTLKAQMMASGSWKSGDPVSLSQLSLIHVSYWGFDNKPHTGSLVVNAQWAARLCTVFKKLYDARFPIHSMNLIDDYGASDRRSMNADNTSSYNGRWRGGTTGDVVVKAFASIGWIWGGSWSTSKDYQHFSSNGQ